MSKKRPDPTGPSPCRLMVVGEAPAAQEVSTGHVFAGKTGAELDNLLRKSMRVYREDVYATNLFKWPLNDKKQFTLEEQLEASVELEAEIKEVDPDVILALGALASHWFVGYGHDMEALNGVPHEWDDGRIVVPCFHPAATFHESALMAWVMEAFEVARGVLDGVIEVINPHPPIDVVPIEDLELGSVVAIDTETGKRGETLMVTAACEEGTGAYAFVGENDLSALVEHVRDPDVIVLLHNALFDIPKLNQVGVFLNRWTDTMQIAFLLQTLPIGLKALAYRLMKKVMKDYDEVIPEGGTVLDVPREDALSYACDDAEATLGCYNRMLPMAYDGMWEVLQRDLDIMPMVIHMMRRGMKVDVPKLVDMEAMVWCQILELQEKIEELTCPFNPGSTQQRSMVLYDGLGLGKGKKIKRTQNGYGCTDEKHLKKIEDEHPVVPLIQEWNKKKHLLDKYIKKLPGHVKKDGRVHADIMMSRVKHSGRFAAKNPPLLNQPTRTAEGREIRNAFVAEDGFKFVSLDMSQIEMRVVAHMAKDAAMIKTFLSGGDIHVDTAMEAFGLSSPDQVDPDKHRKPCKAIGFGVLYGITAHGLARDLQALVGPEWTEDRCQEFIDIWFDIHYGVREFYDNLFAGVRRTGEVRDLFGRMTLTPCVNSAFPRSREEELRRAGNQPVQGGAQGIIKEAMRKIWRDEVIMRRVHEGRHYFLIQIHDDLFQEVHESVIGETVPEVKRIMESAVSLCIPTPVDGKIGDRWGTMGDLVL